ncbi:MAG: hypothetical protein DI551_02175 [Micavibrio aeruginosavorus]|uniref:AsmA domain-containing protein n=1 Tax=Micavibrio aeruginosavorus TaxID=349221 RepID=A0A2W5N3L0_9BACT|nr:MAG: hypothetical protein DI551_02175 [Micavibrio aeruginosavorus]
MKRVLPVVLGIFILLTAALIVGPSFINWDKYKPQIIQQAKDAAGYDIKIGGDIGLMLIPSPRLTIEGLSVAAPRGTQPNLLTMEEAQVSVALFPLISGDVKVNTVRLVKPEINLEKLVDGSNSWMSDKLLADNDGKVASSGGQGQGGGAPSISLDKLVIEDGLVSYSDRSTGARQVVEAINMGLKADTLQGPFDASGSLVYGGKKIEIEARTKRMEGANKEIPADIAITLPDGGAEASFKGVAALEPLEIQGKMQIKADNLGAVLAMGGGQASPALSRKLSFSGLVTANEQQLSSQEMDVEFGDTKGKGALSVTNLKEQNPVQVNANFDLGGLVNLDTLAPAKDKSKDASVEEKVAKGQKLSANAGFLPDTISLPFPIDGTVKISADGIQTGGATIKGIVAQISKQNAAINVAVKAMDIPGKTKADLQGNLAFATASRSGEKGITYADPTLSWRVNGGSEQLPTLLRAFVADVAKPEALEVWKTAQFDLSGTVTPAMVTVTNSTAKLDQTTMALAGSYRTGGTGGKPDVMVDVTTDTLDIDFIQSRLTGQNKQVVQKDVAAKADIKEALKPVRDFSLPVNLTFDFSAQKALFNGASINGIRIKGRSAGESLNLETISVQDYLGAAASLKGNVANLKQLSGVDLSFYGKTSDIKSLMTSLKMDATKLPQTISAAEATIAAKGTAEALAFTGKITAMGGELNASGNATGLLDTPTISNLTIGAGHPNLVKAVQIVNPSFTGGPGLERPFKFNAKAVQQGKAYDLEGMSATLGTTSLNGNLKIDMSGKVPSVAGNLVAGAIPLDDFLGAKKTAPNSSVGGAGSGGSGEKWSRSTIETGWMHSVNLDLDLSAQAITYGGWNFVKPTTKIVLKDGSLSVAGLQSGLFGGSANLEAKVQDPVDPKQPLAMAVQTKMSNVALEPLMFALSGSTRLKASGDVSLDMNVQSSGLSSHALVGGLNGKANLNGKDVVMKGFDLASIGLAFVDSGKPMDRLNSIVGGATSGGETRFDTIVGAYDINQGIVNITNMAMDGAAANIKSKGTANLPLWYIDTVHTITFKQAKDAGAFDVAIKGPLSNPGNTFGKGLFNDLLTRRAQQKLQEKLPDVLGKDLTGKLEGFGILPKQQQTAPAQQTPATDGTATEPATTTPTPAPAQQQEQPQSLQDQIKKDPAAAMQGILKSLGQ